MDCPVCKEPMIVLELDEVEIDYCPSCKGIWLDAGELELLLDDTGAGDALLQSFTTDTNSKEKSRKCPICLKKMKKVLCGKDKNIRIDKCRRNDGLWFDQGELEDIIASASLDEDNRILRLLGDMFGKNVQM